MQYHLDGKLVPEAEATVSVRDRGFAYGDGAFETLRAYGGTVLAWEAHADRLKRTVETLGFAEAIPPRADLRERVRETLQANDLEDAYLKLSITRGVQPGKLSPDERVDPTVVVQVSPLPRGGLNGESVWDEPATLRTVTTRPVPNESIPADAKTHNYLDGILARLELRRTDDTQADEALMRDPDGRVVEGATSNLFFVDGGVLKTPSTDLPLLPGVTRSIVLQLADEEGIPIEEGHYSVRAVRAADEAFLTNTTWELRPVASLDGDEIGGGPMTDLLARLYDQRVEQICY
ncbi:Branched-chain amino acid aminotransferase/4-amino-4-deoxychorismate lyase [Halapricum desulfuricans]|uniref:Branched-chain amino acid aminotransferase/4-amino-4-deoxychorismate lyase n=1 Tax=Halapricum desulfuricans TaxID=2841257 RepID=A0A897NLU8_9EURY|nr:aminotransferase class IV [Halapricum desulfuricans]QSG12435.1 Branched-chain amino acid aminotransferase/4-amino-4-deoxychorismate lyase [Halapricum desulfuricans]